MLLVVVVVVLIFSIKNLNFVEIGKEMFFLYISVLVKNILMD